MDKKARAQHAERLLADDVWQMAHSVVLEYHTSVFSKVSATDEQVLEARRMVLALEAINSQLRSFVGTGKIIEKRSGP